MNLITDTWRGLVRRKLWPVALLLVGALVAVPLFLAEDPEVVPAAAAPANAAAEGLSATYVTAAVADGTEEAGTKRRRTLGQRKDPFAPAPLSKKKKAARKKAAAAEKRDAEKAKSKSSKESPEKTKFGGGDGGGGGASAPSLPSTPSVAPTPTATPAPKAPKHSIRVRFGRTETDLEAATIERLEVLPDEENPILVYRGVEDGGKVAVFELTGMVVTEGDGGCKPTPEDCQILKLRAGETQFITVADTGEETDAQYQLDLIRINK